MGVQQVSSRAEVFGEWLASRTLGQFMFRGIDSVIRLVEKSLMWSTQTAQLSEGTSETGTGASLVVVERPLAWPLFLPLLGFLGVIRVTVYYVTRIFRKPRDTNDIISWLQTKRRRLRAIKYAGIKNMRSHQDDTLTSSHPTTPGQTPFKTPNGKANTSGSGDSPDQEKKRKYCDVEQSDCADSSDDEGVAVKLDKYGENYDSASDPDFEPSSEDESSEDDDSGEGEDEEKLEKELEVIEKSDDAVSSAVETRPISSPSIVTVEPPEMEPVSEHGGESPSSIGSSLTLPASLSPRSKFVKFFRRSRKGKEPL